MEIPDRLHILISATIYEEDESFIIGIPKMEVQLGDVQAGSVNQVSILNSSERQSHSTDTPLRTSITNRNRRGELEVE